MNLLIFENEVQEVIDAFQHVNFLDFDDSLTIRWVTKSQDFKDYNFLNDFDIIIVDIDLSTKSEKDGYGVIDELLKKDVRDKIVIMTGHDVQQDLVERGLSDLNIIKKPIILDDLQKAIEKFQK